MVSVDVKHHVYYLLRYLCDLEHIAACSALVYIIYSTAEVLPSKQEPPSSDPPPACFGENDFEEVVDRYLGDEQSSQFLLPLCVHPIFALRPSDSITIN